LFPHHEKELKVERRKIEGMNQFGFITTIIHVCVEMSQRNSLWSYLKLTKIFFFLLQIWRTGLQRLVPVGGGGYKERA
jgi:hypothetical protein